MSPQRTEELKEGEDDGKDATEEEEANSPTKSSSTDNTNNSINATEVEIEEVDEADLDPDEALQLKRKRMNAKMNKPDTNTTIVMAARL